MQINERKTIDSRLKKYYHVNNQTRQNTLKTKIGGTKLWKSAL